MCTRPVRTSGRVCVSVCERRIAVPVLRIFFFFLAQSSLGPKGGSEVILRGSVNEFGGRAGLEVARCHSGRHDVMDEMMITWRTR